MKKEKRKCKAVHFPRLIPDAIDPPKSIPGRVHGTHKTVRVILVRTHTLIDLSLRKLLQSPVERRPRYFLLLSLVFSHSPDASSSESSLVEWRHISASADKSQTVFIFNFIFANENSPLRLKKKPSRRDFGFRFDSGIFFAIIFLSRTINSCANFFFILSHY